MGKLNGDIVGEANALTKEGTKIGLPAPGDVCNCALEEATSKLGPGEEKNGRSKVYIAASKDKVEARVKSALTMEAFNNSRDKPGRDDEPSIILAEPTEQELDAESSGLMGERFKFEFSLDRWPFKKTPKTVASCAFLLNDLITRE